MGHPLSGGGNAIYQPSVIKASKRKQRAKKNRTARRIKAVLERGQDIRYRHGMGSEFYLTREWRGLRWKVLIASDGKCSMCGRGKLDGVRLHVDHKVPRSLAPHMELQRDNLQVLCNDCNLGKGASAYSCTQARKS